MEGMAAFILAVSIPPPGNDRFFAFLALTGAVVTTIAGVAGLVNLVQEVSQALRSRRWRGGRWGALILITMVSLAAAVGLWLLVPRFWPDFFHDVFSIAKWILTILLVLAALGTAIFAFGNLVAPLSRKDRAQGVGLALLSLLLWIGVVVRFAGLESLPQVPRFFSAVAVAAASIPLAVWAGTVVAAILFSLVLNPGLGAIVSAAWSSGDAPDSSHAWMDHRGIAWGRATRREVYDRYHGRGSWYAMERFWTVVAKIAALAIPVVGPLAVVHLAGWFNVSSPSGVLLAIVLAGISVTGAVLALR